MTSPAPRARSMLAVGAASVSSTLRDRLGAAPRAASVRGAFSGACVLVGADGLVAAVVAPPVGDGPLNIVVPAGAAAGVREALRPGTPVMLSSHQLVTNSVAVSFASAALFDPRPDWAALRASRSAAAGGAAAWRSLRELVARHPASSLLREEPLRAGRAALHAALVQAEVGGGALSAERLRRAAELLAGLGPGLTPAGDDVLCGAMLRAHLERVDAAVCCVALAHAAAPRTTTLAAALLWAAADGECSAAWQRLLAALATGAGVEDAAGVVLAYGATSGVAMLAGFLGA